MLVIVLVVVFPVVVLVGSGLLAAALGSFLKVDSDAANRGGDGPNEYLELARKEAETGYPHRPEPPSLRSKLQSKIRSAR